MKGIKAILSIILVCFLTFALCGCTIISSKYKIETEDTNGEEDHSLAVITEDYIRSDDTECYCVIYFLNTDGDKSYADKDYTHDADKVEASAESPMSGVSIIQRTYGKEETVVFSVDCKRTKGNLRIVLLDEDSNIIHDFDISGESEYKVENAKGKAYEIRAVGESAEFEISASREFVS